MNPLERLGVILLLYGVALHSWHDVATVLLSLALMFCGAVLFLVGGYIARAILQRWPGAPWL